MAFWDQRVLHWLDRWDQGEAPRALDRTDADWINDAGKPLLLALPPRVAARLTVEIAERVDRRLAALPDERIAANHAAGEPLLLVRAHHRKTHLDEIEQILRLTGRRARLATPPPRSAVDWRPPTERRRPR